MNKSTGIVLGSMAILAGVAGIVLAIVKKKKTKLQNPWETGLYTVNMFKKITCDMNKAIAETEKRLAEHDKLQKMYEEMEWKTCNN